MATGPARSALATPDAPAAAPSPPAPTPSGAAAATPVPPPANVEGTPPAAPEAPATPASSSPAPSSPAPPPQVANPPAPAPSQIRDDEELRALIDESAPPRSRINTAAWIGSGVTVLLLGTAAFFGAKAAEKSSDVNRLLGNFDEKTGVPVEYAAVAGQYEQAVRDGRHDDRVAKGFAVAASVAAAASIVLFVVDAVRAPADEPKGPLRSAPSARRSGAPSGGDLGLSWVF